MDAKSKVKAIKKIQMVKKLLVLKQISCRFLYIRKLELSYLQPENSQNGEGLTLLLNITAPERC
jgi:hypothetical protein